MDTQVTIKVKPFSRTDLMIDAQAEAERIQGFLRRAVFEELHLQGAVVGISGGIDSSVVLALCTRAFGKERVLGVMLPERESSPDSTILAQEAAAHFQVQTVKEDITPALEAVGCYQRRDEVIASIFPSYTLGWKAYISLPGSLLEKSTLNVFRLVVVDMQGREMSKRLSLQQLNAIVAASNFKQRIRMSCLFHQAERKNYAVIGTPNKNEHDLGFFVKYGDGGTDVNPISHLFKSQVYMLANFLGVPEEICKRQPTTDTYPGGESQEEFFYRVPFEILDSVWLGYERGYSEEDIAKALDLQAVQVHRVIADIISKSRTTAHLRKNPLSLQQG